MSVTYTTAHGNARPLTHWMRPGMEPATPWLLGGFVNHWAMTDGNSSFFLRAATMAYGDSQARGWIGTVAVGLHPSSLQCWILNSLSKARDWTCVLMDTSQICFLWATMATTICVLVILTSFFRYFSFDCSFFLINSLGDFKLTVTYLIAAPLPRSPW